MLLNTQEISVADISTVSLIMPFCLFEFPSLIYKSTLQILNNGQSLFLVHKSNSVNLAHPLKNKDQLDVTYCFIVLLIGSTCFGNCCAHHQELATIMLITTLVVWFCKDFRFTTLINTNNTSNYQSTNETHYTQNTTITTHKGSQLLILTETRYQLQPSDKELPPNIHH